MLNKRQYMIWYEEEIRRLEMLHIEYTPKFIFYGSSSITQWDTLNDDFKDYLPVNLGFGGSTLAACTWYFERVFTPYRPNAIIIYAGDNDLGDGRHPQEICIFFQYLMLKVRMAFGSIPLAFISIKPSICRWNIKDRIQYTNRIIEEEIKKEANNTYFINIYDKMLDKNGFPVRSYFEDDGLHLSKKGYLLWKEVLLSNTSLFVQQ